MGLFDSKDNQDHAQEDADRDLHAITNDDLLAKWRTFTLQRTEDSMSEFLEELIEHATLLMVVLAEDGADLDNNADLQFPLLTTNDDEHVQPLFSDWLAVNELYDNWNDNGLEDNVARAHVLPVGFLDIAHLVGDNADVAGIVVNPFSDNINLDREMLADLSKQANDRHAEQNEVEIAVSDPETLPDGLWLALETELAEHLVIRRAWLRLMHYSGQAHLILVIDAPEADETTQQRLVERLGSVAADVLGAAPAVGLSVAPLDSDSQALVNEIAPSYQA
ncbi:enhanced serine sensitivity protein SseB C-terminal domain-containing protein [Lacticaseibacillus absianus]|uniref:enhanced serine sensitivity protein SseB C-terminal domain-containing protein n=1 Tax=Lacticaseibacillus absianus TaxID=2729623 RepID=UPI0015C922F8|nr:enhanced serine sensitivity protein SseB C-terminal domain-containing protein [Lacticaseibacillus absianus]